ncbi:MAG: Maf family protein, partial [Candidatus Woodwardiibium sp.]
MIILASGSPRRVELLASLGLEFLVRPAAVDETIDPAAPPDEAVAELSRRKASHVYRTAASPDDTVIAADTLVWQDGCLLGKPADAADAAAMLRTLSGRRHTVHTGLTVIRGGEAQTVVS